MDSARGHSHVLWGASNFGILFYPQAFKWDSEGRIWRGHPRSFCLCVLFYHQHGKGCYNNPKYHLFWVQIAVQVILLCSTFFLGYHLFSLNYTWLKNRHTFEISQVEHPFWGDSPNTRMSSLVVRGVMWMGWEILHLLWLEYKEGF